MSSQHTPQSISKRFAKHKIGIVPDAATAISEASNPDALIDHLIDEDVSKITIDDVETAKETRETSTEDTTEEPDASQDDHDESIPEEDSEAGVEDENESEMEPEVEEETEDADMEAEVEEEDDETENVEDEPVGEDDSGEVEEKEDEGADNEDETKQRVTKGGPVPDVDDTEISEERKNALEALAGGETDGKKGTLYTKSTGYVTGDTPQERWPDVWDDTLLDSVPYSEYSRGKTLRDVSITKDISGNSRTRGEYKDFQKLFRDRFEQIHSLLKPRMPKTVPIGEIDNRMAQRDDDVGIIGIVNEVRKTKNGHDLIELEDTTGTFPVLFSKDYTDEVVKDAIERVIGDEVIGVVGGLADDGEILFGDELYFPDVPPVRSANTADRSVKALLLSDIHFGAVDFAADKWTKFVEWMHTSEEAQEIEYILTGGDLVEGIGVYPGQEEELDIVDIFDQYELCAEALDQLPSDIDIYSIVGNHDLTRLAEPQPVLRDSIRELFGDNVTMTGNPSMYDIEGVKFLIYHGMSLNPFTDRTPGLDIHEPTGAMELMLEKRHLAPMYGMNVRLAPENEDYLVIDDVPDVLLTGHVHTFGIDSYRKVKMVNPGCWQYQTDFQRKLNVEPDVGFAPIIDLETLEIEVKQF